MYMYLSVTGQSLALCSTRLERKFIIVMFTVWPYRQRRAVDMAAISAQHGLTRPGWMLQSGECRMRHGVYMRQIHPFTCGMVCTLSSILVQTVHCDTGTDLRRSWYSRSMCDL